MLELNDRRLPDGMITVIVPCRNERLHIEDFLNSLTKQEWPGRDWEVIIADGASTDGTREILECYCRNHSRFRVIDNPARIVSCGLNAAIRAARGEIIMRMDAHTEYATDYIRQCIEVMRETGADNVGGVPRVKEDNLRSRVLGAAFHSPFAVGGSRCHIVGHEGYVATVSFGCWRRETIERLGGFDENLLRNQDDEFNLRLTLSGGKVWQSNRIVSWYRPRSSASTLFRQHFQYGYWKVAVIRKYRKVSSWRHLVPATFVAAQILLLAATGALAAAGARQLMSWAAAMWLAMNAFYAGAAVIAAVAAVPGRGWSIVPFLTAVFAVYHASYGLGFLCAGVATLCGRAPRLPGAGAEQRTGSGAADLLKSAFDRAAAAVGLILLTPVLLLAAMAIVLEDRGPVFFRQRRVGRNGVPFEILKFRSMRVNNAGAEITRAGDDRVTAVGSLLRRFKIDELPQLCNVIRGEMSLVGPRPEVPRYVAGGDPVWDAVLSVRPGMTDFASLVFRNEEQILARAEDPEVQYRRVILPEKLGLNLKYIRARSFRLDLKLILLTVRYSFVPAGFDPERVRQKLIQ